MGSRSHAFQGGDRNYLPCACHAEGMQNRSWCEGKFSRQTDRQLIAPLHGLAVVDNKNEGLGVQACIDGQRGAERQNSAEAETVHRCVAS